MWRRATGKVKVAWIYLLVHSLKRLIYCSNIFIIYLFDSIYLGSHNISHVLNKVWSTLSLYELTLKDELVHSLSFSYKQNDNLNFYELIIRCCWRRHQISLFPWRNFVLLFHGRREGMDHCSLQSEVLNPMQSHVMVRATRGSPMRINTCMLILNCS